MQSRYAEPEIDGKDSDGRRESAGRMHAAQREGGRHTDTLRSENRDEGFIDSVKSLFGIGGFPDYSKIAKDATVKSACDAAWAETKSTTVDGSRREQGFWVRWNSESKAFSITGHGAGKLVGNDEGAVVALPPKPADTEPEYTVASFHTHTPTFFRDGDRPTGPSGADVSCDKSDNVSGLVYDYSASLSKARSPIDSPARLYSTGQKRTGQPKAAPKPTTAPVTASV
jgi:hypothetical protein